MTRFLAFFFLYFLVNAYIFAQLSKRTMRNEINQLNRYFIDNDFPVLQTIRGKGLRLTMTE